MSPIASHQVFGVGRGEARRRSLSFCVRTVIAAVLAACSVAPVSRASNGVVLNEVVSAAGSELSDEDGDFPPWVELLNTGAQPADLAGYGLSNDPAQPFLWRFPSIVLQPGARTVVYLSGKDRRIPPSPHNLELPPPDWFTNANSAPTVWFDAAAPDAFETADGGIARWRNKSGGKPQPLLGTASDPAEISGLQLWLDGSDTNQMIFQDGRIRSWLDRSGQDHHAVQDSESARPTFSTIPGSEPMSAPRFDGKGSYLNFGPLTNIHSGFLVMRDVSQSYPNLNPILGSTRYYDFHRGDRRSMFVSPFPLATGLKRPYAWMDGEPVDGLAQPVPARLVLLEFVLDAGGRADALGTDRLLDGRFWDGTIAEVALYDRALSDDERLGLEKYLRAKWGLIPSSEVTNLDALQPDPTKRPTLAWNVAANHQVARFDGQRTHLQFPRQSKVQTLIWTGAEDARGGSEFHAAMGDTYYWEFTRGHDRLLYLTGSDGGSMGPTAAWVDANPVDLISFRLPERQVCVATVTATNAHLNLIGSDRLIDGYFWAGEMEEIMAFDRVLATNELAEAQSYLMAKWGLPDHRLHAGFANTAGSSWLMLTSPDGTLADAAQIPAIPPGVSFGRAENGGGAWQMHASPSPYATNTGPTGVDVVPPPMPAIPQGIYTGAVSVTVAPTDPSVRVLYATGGDEPADASLEPREIPWVNGAIPEGALPYGESGSQGDWNWQTADPPTAGGEMAHVSPAAEGVHQHYFLNASPTLAVAPGDVLFADVYLPASTPPLQVMLQWRSRNSWEHRAFWGADGISLGILGTNARRSMGDLPARNSWVRLTIPAEAVGMAGEEMEGIAFTLRGGGGVWGRAGILSRWQAGTRRFPTSLSITNTTVLRLRAFRDGYLPSPLVTATYLIGEAPQLPVVSLVAKPGDLFDPIQGICMPGTNANFFVPHYGANYWKDLERSANIAFFELDGSPGFAQDAGVKIHGGWSRSLPQKSFRLVASERYGAPAFRYQIFRSQPRDSFGTLILRNAGNDWPFAMARDRLGQRLGAEAGLDRQHGRSVLLYVNGAFWGISAFRERLDADFLNAYHKVDKDSVDIIENQGIVHAGDMAAMSDLMSFLLQADLSKPEDYARATNRIDLDSFVDYQLTEILQDNTDWPGNNVYTWRSRTGDTRWRWLPQDLDGCFGILGQGARRDSLTPALSYDPSTAEGLAQLPLVRLMANDGFKRSFLNRCDDLLNTVLTPENVLRALNTVTGDMTPEIGRHAARWASSAPAYGNFTNLAQWAENVDVIRRFAYDRPQVVRELFQKRFDLPGSTVVTFGVSPLGAGSITANRSELTPEQLPTTQVRFLGLRTPIVAVPVTGYRFTRWKELGPAGTNAAIDVAITEGLTLTAEFQPDETQYANTRPKRHDLWAKPFSFTSWAASAPAGTYPSSMLFLQSSVQDPDLAAPLDGEWTLPYNRSSKSRVAGRGGLGISFINTGEPQSETGAGYLGGAVLALNTLGVTNISVRWTGGTIAPNNRVYGLRLQCRVGDSGPWINVLDSVGNEVAYLRSPIVGDEAIIGPVTLPANLENRPLVQLLWKYYFVPSGATGARAELRLDDILVAGQARPIQLEVTSYSGSHLTFQATGPSGRTTAVLASTDLVHWLEVQAVAVGADGTARFSLPRDPAAPMAFYRLRTQ